MRKIMRMIAPAVLIASNEKVSILCVKSMFSNCEYIYEVGVTMNITYCGIPVALPSSSSQSLLIEIGNPVVSLSPKPIV
jgi:hypothetical protein